MLISALFPEGDLYICIYCGSLGHQVLDKSMELRKAVTMRRDFVDLLPAGTKFFHPLCLGKRKGNEVKAEVQSLENFLY